MPQPPPPADCSDPAERRRRIEAEQLPENLWRLLDDAAAAVPNRTLWNFFESGEQATYSDVRARAARLAHGLSLSGVRMGTVVATMLPNIAAFPTSWFALARLGAVMSPINVRYTARELDHVLRDSGAAYLIAHADYLSTVSDVLDGLDSISRERVFIVGAVASEPFRDWNELLRAACDPCSLSAPEPDCDRLVNIQYTSGTTGMPKGCLLTHRYWLTCGKVNARRDGRVFTRILASTPFFYMDPQWLLLMTIFQRATLICAARQSATNFMDWVRWHRIEFCLFPELVLKQPPSMLDGVNSLIRVNIYGVRREHHTEIERRFNVVAREAYGMTETGSAMYMPIEANDMVGSGSCGIPSPFRECRIIGDDGNVLPPGEVGELQVRGPAMMLGYHNNPEANTAAFDDGWFRTGDLFRMDASGYFYIVGRLKEMIRRSGENIAAREVEDVLRGLPDVAVAAVVPVHDDVRGEEVKAYLVLQPGRTSLDVTPELIFACCQRNLASFKVPRYLEYVPDLPKTASGKIAKKVLIVDRPDLRTGSYDRVEGRWR